MRVIAHLLAVLLLVPGIVVATVLIAVDHLRKQPDFFTMADAMLDVLIAFFPGALLGLVAWLALAVLGFSRRLYRAAAIGVAAVAAATSATIVWLTGATDYASSAGIFVPAAFALIIAIWLASTEWPEPERNRR